MLKVAEKSENIVLDMEAGEVKGKDQGALSLFHLWGGESRIEQWATETQVRDQSTTAGGSDIYLRKRTSQMPYKGRPRLGSICGRDGDIVSRGGILHVAG